MEDRVTRLGETSPIGQLLTLDFFGKITEVALLFVLLFHGKSYVLIWQTWVRFWPIFLQTHLVALVEDATYLQRPYLQGAKIMSQQKI
jgi:hypothetical protein